MATWQYVGGTNSSSSGSFTTETLTLTLSNNSQFGYTVYMKSSNGGLLSDADGASASTDGDFIDLQWTCTNVTGADSSTTVATQTANVNLTATNQTILTSENPSVATSAGTSTSTAALVSGETISEALTNPNSGQADDFWSIYTFTLTSATANS